MTAEFQREGTLLNWLSETEQQMLGQEATLIQQGMRHGQAREVTREIGFLSEEDDSEPAPSVWTTAFGATRPQRGAPSRRPKKPELLKHAQQRERVPNGEGSTIESD